jgi:hypothetical protein
VKLVRAVLAVAALTLVVGCAPAVGVLAPATTNLIAPQCPTGYACARTSSGWQIIADSSKPGFTVGSSEDITAFIGTALCKYRGTFPGPRRAVLCNAPNTVNLETRGEIQVFKLEVAPVSVGVVAGGSP